MIIIFIRELIMSYDEIKVILIIRVDDRKNFWI